MIYQFRCIICGEEFECVQPMNIEHKGFHCGIEGQRIWGRVNTEKDLAYNFTTEMFGSPVQINSKGQFKLLLKKNGLADASIKECRQEAEFRKRINSENTKIQHRKTAEKIFMKNPDLLKFRRG